MDILSVSQGDKRFYSFLSQAYGLMADVDGVCIPRIVWRPC
jgi:hypothetical protein